MAFQRYEPQPTTARPDGPTLTITNRGEMRISRHAVDLLGGTQTVELFWDAEARLLAIDPCSPSNPAAHHVPPLRDGGGSRVIQRARGFLDWAGITYTPGPSQRWPAKPETDTGRRVLVDLSGPGEPVTSNRGGQVIV